MDNNVIAAEGQVKVCNTCNLEKDLNCFYFNNEYKKPFARCKECDKKSRYARRGYGPTRAYGETLEIDLTNGWKICCKCESKKDLNEFLFDKNKNLYLTECKECLYARKKLEKSKIPDYKEKRNKWLNNQRKTNKHFHSLEKERRIKQYENNKLTHRMSNSLRESLNGDKNGTHWENLVDYSLENVKKHLESKFAPGMTWDNYGDWNIDHILPVELFTFNPAEDKQFKICWSLKNLQPLWASDNFKKADSLPDGRKARNLNEQQKLDYLKQLGYQL